jgi:hypothetical protein
VSWQQVVRLWADAGRPGIVQPGRDLVLEPPETHVTDLAPGTLLDDLLDADARRALDAEALERLDAWRTARAGTLTLDGVDLPWIWYVELLAEVFVPEVRSVSGVERFLQTAVERVEVRGADPELGACLGAVLARSGVNVEILDPLPPPTGYPRVRTAPWRISLFRRLCFALVNAVGVPSRVRGNVLIVPYWHLLGLYERMRWTEGLVPITSPTALPGLPRRQQLRMLRAGGWTAHPNALQTRRSARRVANAVQAARRDPLPSDDPLGALLDARALRLIEQRAKATLAEIHSLERSLASERVRGVLLSWDSPPLGRTVLAAARRAGKPVVLIEHGFWAEPNNPDKTLSDAAGVWSQAVRRELAPRALGRVVVTGNPGISARLPESPRGRDCTVILPEYVSVLSNRVPARIVPAFVEASLQVLQSTRPGSVALVRPHPADHDPDGYEVFAAQFPGLRLEVDFTSPIDAVLARADLCIGGVSTALLQAALTGVPIVFFNVARVAWPWPFDGFGAIPTAETAEELASLVSDALAGRGQPARQVVEDALGILPDAPERVLALLRETFEDESGERAPARRREPASLASQFVAP